MVSKMNTNISKTDNTLIPENRLSQQPISVINLLARYASTSVISVYVPERYWSLNLLTKKLAAELMLASIITSLQLAGQSHKALI